MLSRIRPSIGGHFKCSVDTFIMRSAHAGVSIADRCELEDRTAVADIQDQLISCLQHCTPTSRRFTRLVDFLVRLRSITEASVCVCSQILKDWPEIEQHPLLLEILQA